MIWDLYEQKLNIQTIFSVDP